MFENLVECSKNKKRDRKLTFFAATAAIWVMALIGIIVGGIYFYDAHLDEQLSLITMVMTPPPPPPPPPPAGGMTKPQPKNNTPVYRDDMAIKEVKEIKETAPTEKRVVFADTNALGNIGSDGGIKDGIPGGEVGGSLVGVIGSKGDATGEKVVVPPPPDPPAPPVPQVVRRSEGVLRGLKVLEVKPDYPMIARTAHVSGDVPVEIVIGEDGRVISARVIGGPPLLQKAAVEAAKQWRFNPTLLNNLPVKVSGVLTFRFTL